MYVFAFLLTTLFGGLTVGQSSPPAPPPLAPPPPAPATAPLSAISPDTLNNGACMDSPRAVPLALMPPAVQARQIVRIDKVVSTATMLQGEVIGYLYTLADGSTWLGQRSPDFMSGADARAINQVLASTHMPDAHITEFPPAMRYGVATKFQQFFKVSIPPAALQGLNIRIDSCVAWPQGRPLPTPSM